MTDRETDETDFREHDVSKMFKNFSSVRIEEKTGLETMGQDLRKTWFAKIPCQKLRNHVTAPTSWSENRD